MVINGKAIAEEMLAETAVRAAQLPMPPILAIVTCAPNFATRSYLALKQRKAVTAGVTVVVHELPATATTAEVVRVVGEQVAVSRGVVVQLPLPDGIDREAALAAIPPTHDPDGFWYGKEEDACLSPVVVAIKTIGEKAGIAWRGQRAAVVGNGRLVGAPASHFLAQEGAVVTVVTDTRIAHEHIAQADVLVTGVGKPGLITSDMVKEGVCVFDAGTSEEGGVLRGDVAPEVAPKAKIFTPVPGGIGPITVAALLANTVALAARSGRGNGNVV